MPSVFKIETQTFITLRLIIVVSAAINLIMLFPKVFKEFYFPTHHSLSAEYLYFGLKGYDALVPWIWTAISINFIGTLTPAFNPGRNNPKVLFPACILLFLGIWIEKGIGKHRPLGRANPCSNSISVAFVTLCSIETYF